MVETWCRLQCLIERTFCRYTTLVDHYVPNISSCLRDETPLVRKQTLTLLTHLLQVKCRVLGVQVPGSESRGRSVDLARET